MSRRLADNLVSRIHSSMVPQPPTANGAHVCPPPPIPDLAPSSAPQHLNPEPSTLHISAFPFTTIPRPSIPNLCNFDPQYQNTPTLNTKPPMTPTPTPLLPHHLLHWALPIPQKPELQNLRPEPQALHPDPQCPDPQPATRNPRSPNSQLLSVQHVCLFVRS